MDPQNLLNLSGRSINDPLFEPVLLALKIKNKFIKDRYGRGTIEDKKTGICFEFGTKHMFVREFGQPKSTFTDDRDEMILQEITFDNNFQQKRKPFLIPLPFGLVADDHLDTICKKIGKKPFAKGEGGDYKLACWFIKDDFRILAALDENKRLLWFRLFVLDLKHRKSIALRKTLEVQNKNIHPQSAQSIRNIQTSMPTKDWETRMEKGDTQFTEKSIAETEAILFAFLELLSAAAKEKKAAKIYTAIKKTIKELNRNNDKHGSFIETLEREELVEFIELWKS